MKEESLRTFIHVKVPTDADLATIERHDCDTDVGSLVEIHILKKKILKLSWQAPRSQHVRTVVVGTKPIGPSAADDE